MGYKPCPACAPIREQERRAARAAAVSAECGLSESQRRQDFSSFRVYKGNEQAFAAARAFADDPAHLWLILAGAPGNGKTHLMSAIGNAAISRGIPTVYAYVPDLLEWLRQGYREEVRRRAYGDEDGDEGNGFYGRFERVKTVDLLLLDDLGTESRTGWVTEKLEALFDYRYRHELPLVCTTNAGYAGVRDLSERIYSRLQRYEHKAMVPITAEPYHAWQRRKGSE